MHSQGVDFISLLRAGVSSTPIGVVLVNAQETDMPIIFANQAFFDITGYRKNEVLGRNCRFLQGAATEKQSIRLIGDALSKRQRCNITLLNYRKNGARFWNKLTLSPIVNSAGVCTHYVGFQQDVTQQYEQEKLLSYQADHDSLTGLINRNCLEGSLRTMLASANLANELIVLMNVNLDDFKIINDGLGYRVGNELIRCVATRLQHFLSAGDLLARLSGDEFLFVFSKVKNCDQVSDRVKEILEFISTPFEIEGVPIHISASVGVSSNKNFQEAASELIQKASIAMTDAKKLGRNTWCWSDGLPENILNNEIASNLRYELSVALLGNQFELFYQPIIDLENGNVISHEALVRWQHPERGLVAPRAFIAAAEKTGQIIPLGYWILRQACLDLVIMKTELSMVVPTAVNISPLQFKREGFFEDFMSLINEFELSTEMIQIEITESLLIDGYAHAIEVVNKFRNAGVKVALDDFGTGYSSLSYLRNLPVDKVKLDRSFIKEVDNDFKSAAIVKAVVDMSHSLGLKVVAEGVENQQQMKVLKGYGCDFVQGFLYSKPMPLSDIMR